MHENALKKIFSLATKITQLNTKREQKSRFALLSLISSLTTDPN